MLFSKKSRPKYIFKPWRSISGNIYYEILLDTWFGYVSLSVLNNGTYDNFKSEEECQDYIKLLEESKKWKS